MVEITKRREIHLGMLVHGFLPESTIPIAMERRGKSGPARD
jgi:hypothetical protein